MELLTPAELFLKELLRMLCKCRVQSSFHRECNKEPILPCQVGSEHSSSQREMGEWEGKLFWGYKNPEGLLFP